jgi:ABC-2 type transport system permease protein
MTPESIPQTANPGAPSSTTAPSSSKVGEQTTAPRISEPRRLFWCIRREVWENRSLYVAPLAVAALILLGFLYSTIRVPADTVFFTTTTAVNGVVTRTQHGIDPIQIYNLAAALIMGTTFLVAIFYCLDALYGERRDRSILFWKSLPISDLATVLSKATIPLILLPLLTWAITVLTQALMLLANLAVFHARGIDTTALHTNLPLAQSAITLLYHLVTIHALWYAPIYAWLLLVSAWARKAPLLWAVLPPLALGVLELIAFHTTHFFDLLKYRFHGPEVNSFAAPNLSVPWTLHLDFAAFFSTPGLWEGLALAAVLLAAAIQLRRYRTPL